MINDHIFYVGVCPNTGESIITPLPFYAAMTPEKRELALGDLMAWLTEERNKAAEQMANNSGAISYQKYALVTVNALVKP